jgi:hypothetical protein
VILHRHLLDYDAMNLGGGINVSEKHTASVFRANTLQKFGERKQFSWEIQNKISAF